MKVYTIDESVLDESVLSEMLLSRIMSSMDLLNNLPKKETSSQMQVPGTLNLKKNISRIL